MTLHWLNAAFMVGILIPNKCTASVVAAFDPLTQGLAHLALSHVNAYVRLSQSDRTPFDVFEFLYSEGKDSFGRKTAQKSISLSRLEIMGRY